MGPEGAAAHGARLFDHNAPTWREGLSLETLDAQVPERAILSQVFGTPQAGRAWLEEHGIADDASRYFYGFDLPPSAPQFQWDKLTAAWRWEFEHPAYGDKKLSPSLNYGPVMLAGFPEPESTKNTTSAPA